MRQNHIIYLILTTLLTLISISACSGMGGGPTPDASPVAAEAATAVPAPLTPTPEPETEVGRNLIQLAWFYNPPIDKDLDALAKNFDVFILTKNYEGERETLRELGVTAPLIKYLAFFEIQALPCDEQPWQNNAAYKMGDFCDIEANHPDWFLKDDQGEPLCYHGFCAMDPGNAEWLNFWLQRAMETQGPGGWDGIFMDNVEAGLGKRIDEDFLPATYPEDERYQQTIENALRFFYEGYFKPNGRPLYANIIAVEDWDVWLRYLTYLDGVMVEDFAVDWGSGHKTTAEWEAQMDAIEKAQRLGKNVILVAQGMSDDYERQEFSFASYLLINEGRASFRYTEDRVYDEIWLYDNYDYDFGLPLGGRFKDGDRWVRKFTNGEVSVDPVENLSSITLY